MFLAYGRLERFPSEAISARFGHRWKLSEGTLRSTGARQQPEAVDGAVEERSGRVLYQWASQPRHPLGFYLAMASRHGACTRFLGLLTQGLAAFPV